MVASRNPLAKSSTKHNSKYYRKIYVPLISGFNELDDKNTKKLANISTMAAEILGFDPDKCTSVCFGGFFTANDCPSMNIEENEPSYDHLYVIKIWHSKNPDDDFISDNEEDPDDVKKFQEKEIPDYGIMISSLCELVISFLKHVYRIRGEFTVLLGKVNEKGYIFITHLDAIKNNTDLNTENNLSVRERPTRKRKRVNRFT